MAFIIINNMFSRLSTKRRRTHRTRTRTVIAARSGSGGGSSSRSRHNKGGCCIWHYSVRVIAVAAVIMLHVVSYFSTSSLLLLSMPFVDGFSVVPSIVSPFSSSSSSSVANRIRRNPDGSRSSYYYHRNHNWKQRDAFALFATEKTISVEPKIDDDKVTSLFAWLSRAFAGDSRYGNLMYAFAAIFGNDLPDEVTQMVTDAEDALRLTTCSRTEEVGRHGGGGFEEVPMGEPISTGEREIASLGAMGAAQWSGQFTTRPHAILNIQNFTSVDDWVATLPRGCRRTIKKAIQNNNNNNTLEDTGMDNSSTATTAVFNVTALPIRGDAPAPHSSLAHFRCVMAHELRLIADTETGEGFFDALQVAISRYQGTTQMAGVIREYKNITTGKVIAIAHEVRKGRVVRGQWFYADDAAAKNYVWFHSVYDLVKRSIEENNNYNNIKKGEVTQKGGTLNPDTNFLPIDCVDLGPSGTDGFSQLKEKYGFVSVADWTKVADYTGPFHYEDEIERLKSKNGQGRLYEQQLMNPSSRRGSGNWFW